MKYNYNSQSNVDMYHVYISSGVGYLVIVMSVIVNLNILSM